MSIMHQSEAYNIADIYQDVQQPGSLGGIARFAKHHGKSLAATKQAVTKLDAYTLNKESRRRFPRRAFISTEPLSNFGADILDLSQWQYQNRRYRYMLVVSDMFTKEVFLEGLKKKSAPVTAEAMERIIRRAGIPKGARLGVDRGNEFNAAFQQLLNKYNITKYSTNSLIKMSPIERINRTLRSIMRGLFTVKGRKNWIDHLPDIEKRFNTTVSTVTKFTPIDVKNNIDKAFFNTYHKHVLKSLRNKGPNIPIGSKVRVSDTRWHLFTKGPAPWSKEVFEIHSYKPSVPVGHYLLKDQKNNILDGGFYENELQKLPSV